MILLERSTYIDKNLNISNLPDSSLLSPTWPSSENSSSSKFITELLQVDWQAYGSLSERCIVRLLNHCSLHTQSIGKQTDSHEDPGILDLHLDRQYICKS